MRKNKFKEDQPINKKNKSSKFDYLHKEHCENKKSKLFSDLSKAKQKKKQSNYSSDSSKNKVVIVDNKIRLNKVAFSEIVHVIKEEDHFPLKLSNRVPLKTIIFYYNKHWNGELESDSDNIESDSDK